MATVEYVALVVLVSLVVVVGGAVAGAPGIGDAVGAQLRKAYCVVQGGDCFGRNGPRTCVIDSRSDIAETRAGIGLVRLRDGRTALVEELSDGTFRVTESVWSGGGVGLELGAQVHAGGRALDVTVEGEAGGDLRSARTFIVADATAAGKLVDRLEDDGPPVGEAVAGLVRFVSKAGGAEVERTLSVKGRAEAQAALELLGLGPTADVLADLTGGVRIDRRTGDVGLVLRMGREAGAALDTVLAQAGGRGVGSGEAELVLDRSRRPRELIVRTAGAIHGSAGVPSGAAGGGQLLEAEARLDLTDPQARALADRVLAGEPGAVTALAGRVADRARIDVRRYATTREEHEIGGSLLGFGGSRVKTSETARLVAAAGREPGQDWARRLDCVRAA